MSETPKLTFDGALAISHASQTKTVAVLSDLTFITQCGCDFDWDKIAPLRPVRYFREPHGVSGVMMALAKYL